MNFWTGLILGIIIGWLVEWIIDWLFWRRDAEEAREQELLIEERLAEAESTTTNLEVEWESRLAAAEQDYQTRLRAVEEEWQARLNLNEQQWQSQFSALEGDNDELRTRMAGVALGAAGVALANELVDESPDEEGIDDELIVADLVEDDAEFFAPAPNDAWQADQLSIETGDLSRLDGMDGDMAERLHLAGIDSLDDLAAADPTSLSVALGLEQTETENWISRAAAALPVAGLALVAASEGKAAHRDDLTRVHGIGPKYADMLADAGITSFDELGAATPDELRDIIKPSAMQQINFDSWAAQARALAGTRAARTGDDLTELEGIGPVYAQKLRERGITTFSDLAEADESTLAGIIAAPAWRRINYGDWITQAQLAAGGDSTGLAELQSRLYRRAGDNLGLIHGMGGRSAAALQSAGISSFTDLAAASPTQLDSIMRDAGVRGNFDYEAWIGEAAMRASGKRVATGRTRTTHVVPCPQDLSAVPGIGPVFEERLYAAGIGSYWALAELPAAELSTVLDARSLQSSDLETIKGAAMKLAAETNSLGRVWDGTPPDDFDVLTGIGEVYERRLYEAGICTYETMAATTPERLAEICKAPRMRTPDYAAWVVTAAEMSAAKRSG